MKPTPQQIANLRDDEPVGREGAEMSFVRENLMNDKDYRPYCGEPKCRSFARTIWKGKQFQCNCGWQSEFADDFISEYKSKWNIQEPK